MEKPFPKGIEIIEKSGTEIRWDSVQREYRPPTVEVKCGHCQRIKRISIYWINRKKRLGKFTGFCVGCTKRPWEDYVIKKTGSIIHWNSFFTKKRNRYGSRSFLKITCGRCKQTRIVPYENVKQSLKSTRRNKTKYSIGFTGCCTQCQHKLPWDIKFNNRPRTVRKLRRGYRKIYMPEHPMADKRGEVFEHRIVMSQKLGRNLNRYEHVHHINGDKSDNRIENLHLIDPSTHCLTTKLEGRVRQLERFILENKLVIPLPPW